LVIQRQIEQRPAILKLNVNLWFAGTITVSGYKPIGRKVGRCFGLPEIAHHID
jgi:hypothetical protein